MKKKLLSGLLSLVLALSLIPAAAAAPAASQTQIAQALAALEIMVGDENGNLNLSAPVTRAEFVKMAVAASPYRDNVGDASVSPYPDVPRTHWAAGHVQAAVNAGLITGYLDGTFRPGNTISLAEGVTVVLRLLGYQNSDFSGAYPSGQMALYRSLDLDVGVTANENAAPLSRFDCMHLFYNLLTANSKLTGAPYITALGYSLTPSGEVDLVTLVNASMDGPTVASGTWQTALGFDPSTAKVYRSGVLSSFDAIAENDVVYWSKPMRTLWVYTNRTSGIVTALSPSASAPSAVTVGGKTYSIETAIAAFALSDLNGFRVGTPVTLLLGRTGGVAAVLTGTQAASVHTVQGLVTAVAPSTYADAYGNTYTADTVTLIATDGTSRSYRCDNTSLEAGDLAEITVSGEKVTARILSSVPLSGSFNSAGTKLGSYSLADDIEILDVYKQSAARVYPSRLAGVTLNASAIHYYRLNSAGEIDRLILADVAGDQHIYGVLTDVTEFASGLAMASTGVYVYDAAGIPGVVQGAKVFSVSEGPMVLKMDGSSTDRISNLSALQLTSASGSAALSGGKAYALSDSVVVYELRSGDYFLSSLDLVNNGSYTLTGYYDKPEQSGGRIRVIVAK